MNVNPVKVMKIATIVMVSVFALMDIGVGVLLAAITLPAAFSVHNSERTLHAAYRGNMRVS